MTFMFLILTYIHLQCHCLLFIYLCIKILLEIIPVWLQLTMSTLAVIMRPLNPYSACVLLFLPRFRLKVAALTSCYHHRRYAQHAVQSLGGRKEGCQVF